MLGMAPDRPEPPKSRFGTASAKNKELRLMDRLQASTFAEQMWGVPFSEATRKVLQSYRIKLRQAERFILDDEAVKLVCHLCHEEDRLPSWSFLARIPFPVTWIEFDLHTKVREFDKMNTLMHPFVADHVAPTAGYLLYKEADDSPRWIAHEFKEVGGEAVPGFIAFIFDPEGDAKIPIAGSTVWKSPTLSRRPGFPRIPVNIQERPVDDDGRHVLGRSFMTPLTVDPEFVLCGLFQHDSVDFPVIENPENPNQVAMVFPTMDNPTPEKFATVLKAPDWFAARSGAIVDPFWEQHLGHRSSHHSVNINNVVGTEVIEQSGIMRWLVTLFASLNALPRMVKPIHTRTGTHTAARLRHLPFMKHRNLTIEIPRDNRIVWARKHLDREAHGARRAWHPVIGHWRIIEYGKAPNVLCRHQPTMVEAGVGICENCELLVRWIEVPNGRGDPAIGVVDHTYKIAGRKRGRRP